MLFIINLLCGFLNMHSTAATKSDVGIKNVRGSKRKSVTSKITLFYALEAAYSKRAFF